MSEEKTSNAVRNIMKNLPCACDRASIWATSAALASNILMPSFAPGAKSATVPADPDTFTIWADIILTWEEKQTLIKKCRFHKLLSLYLSLSRK